MNIARRSLSVVLLLLSVASPTAWAWSPLTANGASNASPMLTSHWPGGAVTYKFNLAHGSNITLDGATIADNTTLQSVVTNSFASWQGVSNTSLNIQNGGAVGDASRSNVIGSGNVVFFQDSASQSDLGGALALTFTQFSFGQGSVANITDADIVFNMSKTFFTTTPPASNSGITAFDLQTVLTHEIGHFLGLDHSSVMSATMFQAAPAGLTHLRTLSDDDKAAIRTTYAGATALGSISGRVRKSGAGVLGASVFAVDAAGAIRAATISQDSQGSFTISGLQPGTYRLGVEPLDLPMTQGNLGGFYQVNGTFDEQFGTVLPSGNGFSVTTGNTAAGDVQVTAPNNGINPTFNTGIVDASSGGFSWSGSSGGFVAGTSGKQLFVINSNSTVGTVGVWGTGLADGTVVTVPGSGIVVGTAGIQTTQLTYTRSGVTKTETFDYRRFGLTIPTTVQNGSYNIAFDNGSSNVAILQGGLRVSNGVDPEAVVVNTAPTITLASASTTLAQSGDRVNLTGRATDPESDTISYSWARISGPLVTIQNSATADAFFDSAGEGTLLVRLTINDGHQHPVTADVSVPLNAPPTPVLPAPLGGTTGQEVVMAGGATDPGSGETLSYQWTQILGINLGLTVNLTGGNTATARFTPTVPGTYGFTLTAFDGRGGSNTSSELDVTVVQGNRPPVPNAGSPQTVTGSGQVTLTGSATDPDGDTNLTYSWTQTGGPDTVFATAQPGAVVTFNPTKVGTYTFRLSVSDGLLAATSDVSVERRSLPPTARITGGPAQVQAGATVTLSGATSTDPDSEQLTYSWREVAGSSRLNLGATGNATLGFTTSAIGDYLMELLVNDPESMTSSARITISVTPRPLTPTADAGADRSVPVSSEVMLDGRGSRDPLGLPLTFSWDALSTPQAVAVAITDATSAVARFTVPVTGTYEIQLTVSNSANLTSTSIVRVTAEIAAPVTTGVELRPGLNFISLPLQPATTGGGGLLASQFARLAGSQFVARVAPNTAISSRFQVVVLGNAQTLDFQMQGGQGYILSVPSSRTVSLTGRPWPASARDAAVQEGINLIGLPGPVTSTFDAAELGNRAGSNVVVAPSEGAVDVSGKWRVYILGLSPTFPLSAGKAYLVPAPRGRLPFQIPGP